MPGESSSDMKAARFYDHHDIRIDSIPRPVPKGDEIVVDIAWSGICGTDLHEYLHGPLIIRTKEKPHPITGEFLPVTMGHEFCGHVNSSVPKGALSADGTILKTGDAVMIDPRIWCTACFACRDGHENTCDIWGFLGLNRAGGFAEAVAVRPSMCHILPPGIPLDHAALIEPLAVGRHALTASAVPMDSWKDLSVLVIGGGPVGIAVLCNLRVAGATRVYVSEPSASRREHTRQWAKAVFNPIEEDIPKVCRELTDNKGVDIVFDCAGVRPGMTAGMNSLRTRGVYVNIAGWDTDVGGNLLVVVTPKSLMGYPSTVLKKSRYLIVATDRSLQFIVPINHCMTTEITIKFSLAYDKIDFRNVFWDFIEGKFQGVESMITGRIALEDLVQDGFEQLINHTDRHVKIIATPQKELIPTNA